MALAGAGFLVYRGHLRLLWLVAPGLAVFAWHLWLISRRQERGRMGIELVGSGVLALAAPAAYWLSGGDRTGEGWLLWGIAWLQSAASIVFVYLRLRQRRLDKVPSPPERWRMGVRALLYHFFNLLLAALLAALRWVPIGVPFAFLLMLLDALDGVARPAVGTKPVSIGLRQLASSSLFVLVVVLSYLF
jgi:hypothetical protein